MSLSIESSSSEVTSSDREASTDKRLQPGGDDVELSNMFDLLTCEEELSSVDVLQAGGKNNKVPTCEKEPVSIIASSDNKGTSVGVLHDVDGLEPIRLRGEGEPTSTEMMPDGRKKLTWFHEYECGSSTEIITFE